MHPKVFSICHLYFSISLRAIYNSRQRNCEKQAKAIDPWWRCTVPQCVGPGSVNGRASLGWLWNTDAGTNQAAELSCSSGGSAIIYIILDSFEIKVNRRALISWKQFWSSGTTAGCCVDLIACIFPYFSAIQSIKNTHSLTCFKLSESSQSCLFIYWNFLCNNP